MPSVSSGRPLHHHLGVCSFSVFMNPSPLGFNMCDVLCHRGRAVVWRPLQGWRRPWTPLAQHLPFTPVAAVFREAQNDPERRQDQNPSFPTSPCGPWLCPLPCVISKYLSLPSVALHQPVPRPKVCSSAPPPCLALFHWIISCRASLAARWAVGALTLPLAGCGS